MPARRTNAVLKLLNGSAQHDRAKFRDEAKVTPKGRLEGVPAYVKLTKAEREVFDWYVKAGAMAAVHRPTDAVLLAAVARVTVALEAAHATTLAEGAVVCSGSGLPRLSPYVQLERQLMVDLRGLLNELGMTPAGRLKVAPSADAAPRDGSAWDEIDG